MRAGTEAAALLIAGKLAEGSKNLLLVQALQQQVAKAGGIRNIAFDKRQQLRKACRMLAAANLFAYSACTQVDSAVNRVYCRRFANARRSAERADFSTQTLAQSLYAGALLCRQRKDLVANRLLNTSHLLNQSGRRSILLIQHKDSRNARQLRQRQQLIRKDKAEIRRSAGKGRHK